MLAKEFILPVKKLKYLKKASKPRLEIILIMKKIFRLFLSFAFSIAKPEK